MSVTPSINPAATSGIKRGIKGQAGGQGPSKSSKDRAKAAVIGSLLADAAAMPVHWIYDESKLKAIIKDRNPEFVEKSHCPFYSLPTGKQSAYGDQIYALLTSLVECKGFNKEDYKKRLYAIFGPNTQYDVDKSSHPMSGGYRHGSIKGFLDKYKKNEQKTGAADAQADGFVKVAPLVAMYAGAPDMLNIIEDAVRVTQEDDIAVNTALAGAVLLENYILYGKSDKAINEMLKKVPASLATSINETIKRQSQSHSEAVQFFGSSCALPNSFQGTIHCLLKSDGDYVNTLRMAISSPGDMVARSTYVGACLGAWVGTESLPNDWINKMERKDVGELADKLVALCHH